MEIVAVVISVIGIAISVATALSTSRSARRTEEREQARTTAVAIERFWSDEDVGSAFAMIDYGKFVYDPDTFEGSDRERQVDKLLRLFGWVCSLLEKGIVSDRDVEPLRYYMLRVWRDVEVQKSLADINKLVAAQQAHAPGKQQDHPMLVYARVAPRLSRYEAAHAMALTAPPGTDEETSRSDEGKGE